MTGDEEPSSEPDSASEENALPKRITRSDHAKLRSGQGRPIGQVVNDVQKARANDVFLQPEDAGMSFAVRTVGNMSSRPTANT
jgi:hypothetical protein